MLASPARSLVAPLAVLSAVSGAACGAPLPDLAPLGEPPAYAVVFSDYSSSSIALLDHDASPMAVDWVTSGTRMPILAIAVSGDVVLPREPLGRGLLAWIDRYPTDVLTLVDPTDPAALSQLDLRGDRDGATAFSPNPHAALRLPDGRVLVSRHNPDLSRLGSDMERGNDLLAIDLGTGIETRVALGCDGPDGILGRPDDLAMLESGGRAVVVVALARLGAAFGEVGEGALVTVDAETLAVLDCAPLPETANCQYVSAVPGAADHAIALCTGTPFSSESVRRETASVLEIALDGEGRVEIVARLDGREVEPGLVPTAFPLPLGGGRLLAIADGRGEDGRRPDSLLSIDLGAGTVTVLAETGPFTLGLGTASTDSASMLVPDGTSGELLRYSLAEARVVERIAVPTRTGLPLRQISRL